NFSTRAGSLAIILAIADSVDSDTLRATAWALCVFSSFTTSSIAPTLFGRNTENCFTSGPSIFEVVSGKLTVILKAAPGRLSLGAPDQLSHSHRFVGKPNISLEGQSLEATA